jgi:hypothetical protein
VLHLLNLYVDTCEDGLLLLVKSCDLWRLWGYHLRNLQHEPQTGVRFCGLQIEVKLSLSVLVEDTLQPGAHLLRVSVRTARKWCQLYHFRYHEGAAANEDDVRLLRVGLGRCQC